MDKGKPSRHKTPMELQRWELSPVGALSPEVMDKIGEQLRLMYDEVVNQGVPDRFAELLRRLDAPTEGGSENE
jgi:hypothetical protein